MPVADDAMLREILSTDRRLAVLGIKEGAGEDAFKVPAYMQLHGYEILGVNPKLQQVLEAPCVARLADLPGPVDLVNVFRAAPHIPAHTDEILALPRRPRTVWLQLGIRDDESATQLEAAGIRVVQDRCILVEHRRLLGNSLGPQETPRKAKSGESP